MGKRLARWTLVVGAAVAALLPIAATGKDDAESAKAQMQETSEKVLAIFRDRDVFAPERTDELLARLRGVLDERFDWLTIARWVLAQNRRLFDDPQTEEFAAAFRDYVVLHYLTQVEHHVTGADATAVDGIRIVYGDAGRRADGSLSLDIVFVTARQTQVSTAYTLVHDPALGWRVRNFIVEGVSLVRNWRSELAPLRTRERIMDLLQSKTAEMRKARLQGAQAEQGE